MRSSFAPGISDVVFDYFEDFRSAESGEDDAGVSHLLIILAES
jgi:hypothetical protein